MLKLAGAGANSFMLESVTGGETRGRYSVIGMKPDLIWEMIRPTITIVLDGVKGEVIVTAPVWVQEGVSAKVAYAQAAERVADAVNDLDRQPPTESRELTAGSLEAEPVSNTSKERYFEMVEQARAYIKAGDIFQVVPSQRWTLNFDLPPFSLYRALRRTNPSPYMFYFNLGDFQIVGASPETLVSVKDKQVTIRPIAGTRPRGKDAAEDKALEADLLGDPKECAEHLMLLEPRSSSSSITPM